MPLVEGREHDGVGAHLFCRGAGHSCACAGLGSEGDGLSTAENIEQVPLEHQGPGKVVNDAR